MSRNCFISIGNSDNKLTQAEWANFIDDIDLICKPFIVHGRWFSAPDSQWQNACWCVEHPPGAVGALRPVLSVLAERYGQESIAMTLGEPEFIEARK